MVIIQLKQSPSLVNIQIFLKTVFLFKRLNKMPIFVMVKDKIINPDQLFFSKQSLRRSAVSTADIYLLKSYT